MAYADYPFPPSTPIYPPASVVCTYLRRYAEHFGLIPHIRFNTTVVSVEQNSTTHQWEVTISTGESFLFDSIVVCNGKYRVPRFPDTPGLDTWLSKGKASHSAWYRRPADLSGNNVILVVGCGPSGRDITIELLSVPDESRTIIHSITGASNEDKGNLKIRGQISRFDDNNNGQGRVVFEDGTIESGIDYCILATGYQMSFPFFSDSVLRDAIPPFDTLPALPDRLYNTTYGVFPFARHIFPLRAHDSKNLTLAFMIGLPIRVVPFPLFEAQARAIFHVFDNPNSFDCIQETKDIIARYEQLLDEVGNSPARIAKVWHVVKGLGQFDYRDQLHELAKESFRVEEWERLMYANKDVLRQVWKMLEKSGEAENWVKGIGENGRREWVGVLERMLGRAREEGLPVVDL